MVEGLLFFSVNDDIQGEAFRTKDFLLHEVFAAVSIEGKDTEVEIMQPSAED